MKKFLSLTISLVLTCCFFVSPVSAHESTFNHTLPDIVIDSDVEIPENILEELQNEYPDAVQITIYGYYEVPEPTVPEIVPQYVNKISKVNKTTTQYNVMTKNEFIISVAKGQTIQLSSTTTFSLEANVSGKASVADLGLKSSISQTFTTSMTWTGPEANSTANSREYRIKFYENQGTYTAVRQFGPTGMGFEEISGTWSEPVKYLQYSIDHRVS